MAKASEYWEDVSTEYVKVCTVLSMGVLNIYRMDLDIVGVQVYLGVWNRNREILNVFLYCCYGHATRCDGSGGTDWIGAR